MKRILSRILAAMYRIRNSQFRRFLRGVISRLEGGQAFSGTLRKVMRKYHGFDIGIGTYGACFDPSKFYIGGENLRVGKFTSIASEVSAYTRNHPYWYPSTSPLFYNREFCDGKVIGSDTVPYGTLTVGNDVWIGQYVVILPSCKRIGDGAVIGAGSILTKDVPDYAVVVGNPGRIIKYRFSESQIEQLKQIKWWDWDIDFLKNNARFFSDFNAVVNISQQIQKE